jgi:hypothetical protein
LRRFGQGRQGRQVTYLNLIKYGKKRVNKIYVASKNEKIVATM